jgi:hypothetical protein
LSRLAALATLVGGLALATCSYAPMPGNGAQMCASASGKQCPDGYYCAADRCFRNGAGGAGGALSGAAGKGGAGGHAGGGGAGAAGAGGAGAAGGAAGQQMCEPAFANTWSGNFSVIDSGSVPGPTYTVNGGTITILETHTATAAGAANIGLGWQFSPCADASAFTGVSFSISGTVSGCSVLFQVDDTERSGGSSGGPSVTIGSVTSVPATVKLAWSTAGGQPAGPVDAARIAILIWGFGIPASSSCMANIQVSNLTFY